MQCARYTKKQQKTHTQRSVEFFRKCDRSEEGTSFTGSESWYSIFLVPFSQHKRSLAPLYHELIASSSVYPLQIQTLPGAHYSPSTGDDRKTVAPVPVPLYPAGKVSIYV